MGVRVGNVAVVARREFLERVQKKSFIIMTIITPLLFGAMMVVPALMAFVKTDKVSKITVLDTTGWVGQALVSQGRAKEEAQAAGVEMPGGASGMEARRETAKAEFILAGKGENVESLKAKVISKEIDGILQVEPDSDRDAKAIFYGLNLGNMELISQIDRSLFRVALEHRLSGSGLDPSMAERLQKRVRVDARKVEKSGKTKEGSFLAEYLKAVMLSMLLYMLILLYGQALMRGVMEEKNGKIAEVVLSSVRPFEWMFGKIVGISSVGLLQYVIWFALGAGLYLANPLNFVSKAGSSMVKPLEMVLMVVYFLLGFFLYAAFYAALGSICSSETETQNFQMPVVLCLVMPMFILPVLVQNPDAGWIVVLSMIPLFTPTLMIVRASLVSVPLWQILLSMLTLAAGVVAMAYIGGKIYRVGILMTGKRPTIPEIMRWVGAR